MILKATAEGTIDTYAWRDEDGNLVDTWAVAPGTPCEDHDISIALSNNYGRPVVFTGQLSVQEAVQLIQERDL